MKAMIPGIYNPSTIGSKATYRGGKNIMNLEKLVKISPVNFKNSSSSNNTSSIHPQGLENKTRFQSQFQRRESINNKDLEENYRLNSRSENVSPLPRMDKNINSQRHIVEINRNNYEPPNKYNNMDSNHNSQIIIPQNEANEVKKNIEIIKPSQASEQFEEFEPEIPKRKMNLNNSFAHPPRNVYGMPMKYEEIYLQRDKTNSVVPESNRKYRYKNGLTSLGLHNPITNPIPFFNQNPYISREIRDAIERYGIH